MVEKNFNHSWFMNLKIQGLESGTYNIVGTSIATGRVKHADLRELLW